VVAFDCFSGPREIIENNKNGLLVENQNFDKLILAMNDMLENKALYQECKKNAVASVSRFSIAIIGKQWLDYFKIIER
jgi:N-acetylgalactosamine-N,N'-diacetylbacillosaminyl-diphospho-undecaprenol 4-alpha-N-acetylgalactosaminyltransferase